jgi:Spy/CpxP family protein refolding chaperone
MARQRHLLALALLNSRAKVQPDSTNQTEVITMKTKHVGMVLVVLAVIGLIGYAADSFAWGRGGGYGMGPGYGNCPRAGFGGPGMAGNLTDEEIATMQKERNAFLESTRELRERHYQKELELKAELAKQNPDAKKAAELQKEVSGFENELNQKRLEHQLKMKKEHPELYGKGFGGGFGRGMGPGRGMGMGPGRGPCPGGGPCQQ